MVDIIITPHPLRVNTGVRDASFYPQNTINIMRTNMTKNHDGKTKNKLTLDGVIYQTSGNIVFADPEENPFHLAQSALLEQMDDFVEHGMQTLLKKIKN
jgi:predicted heme/steroid binding protein